MSDSDDDFERFLREDDSASASSASPVKRKVVQKSVSRSKTKADSKPKAKTSSSSTSNSRRGSSGSSLSVVAAAERLLAASGKGRSKAKPAVVEEEDEDAEEPPPSYSDDPYAFELGAKASYLRSSDEEKDEEEDSDDDLYRASSRREDAKSKKKASSRSDKESMKDKKTGREPVVAKREVKSAKTLEERVAEILKRTGSTTAFTPTVAAEEKESEDDDDDDGENDNGDEEEDKRAVKGSRATTGESSKASGKPVATHDTSGDDGSDGEEGSDLHRLSFSDSLGMESADFEVGLHARRKSDQSRMSLSSLNSEKFAVNMDALEESELPSHNRYDRQNDDFGQSLGTSDGVDGSDYGDDGFELDQTTDAIDANEAVKQVASDDQTRSTDAPSPFVSEFEKMKSLFSLESPPKVSSVNEAPSQEQPSPQPQSPHPPPESDTFGYDDEDFETDEVKASVDKPSGVDESTEPDVPVADQAYGDDEFEGDEPSQLQLEPELDLSAGDASIPIVFPEDSSKLPDENHPTVPPVPTVPTVVDNIAPSYTTDPTSADISTPKATTPTLLPMTNQRTVPSPPLSPPPPPPPDEEDTAMRSEPPPRKPPQGQSSVLLQQRQGASVDNSHDRFRVIESQVSSLRFLRPASRREPSSSPTPSQPTPQVIEDEAMAEEMKEIERLLDQARHVRKDRRKSISVRSSAKESELALRLQQAQRHILQFKQHVQELAGGDDDAPEDEREELQSSRGSATRKQSGSNSRAATPPKASDPGESTSKRKEAEQLRKEVETQERLIQGFQRENEQLMKQLKQVQRDLHYDVHKENEALRVQLKELRTQLDRAPRSNRDGSVAMGSGEDKTQYRAAIEARLHAEALAESLQEDLNAQAKRHQAALNEMKIELEKVKKAKIDLECKYEGLDVRKMESETRQIKALKDQIQMQTTEHDHARAALQKKIDWYVNNQRLLDEQDEKMNALREENKQLKQELRSRDGDHKSHGGAGSGAPARSPITPGKAGGGRSPADIRRIQELESRLSEMEQAMRRRHPDSLVSLIVASRKAEEESTINDLTTAHQEELDELRDEMELQQSEHEKRLNAFRQQQEKLVLQYQKQIASLERQLNNKENQRSGTTAQNSHTSAGGRTVKKTAAASTADETELYRVRRFYAEKIKEVERKWEAKYRSLKKQQYAGTGSTAGVDPTSEREEGSPSDTARVIRGLQQQLKAQDDELRKLHAADNGGGNQATSSWEASSLLRRVESLENQLKTSEDARRHLIETLTSLNAVTSVGNHAANSQEARDKAEAEFATRLKAAKDKHDDAVAEYRQRITTLEKQLADQSTAAQTLRTQFATHIKEVERLQLLLTEAEHEKKMLQDAAARLPALESEVSLLRQQLAVPQTPSMLQFRSLELRIETLAQKHQLREAELKTMLMQATQSSQLEKLQYERRYEQALALKNAEILSFKKQLEEILDELELLRASQSS